MTREEAYNRIDAIIAKYEIDDEYVTITNGKDYDALRMARKILDQDPCEDAISRQAVLDLVVANHTELNGVNVVMYSPLCKDIKQLPSVNPTKTGHWIKMDRYDPYWYMCSECCRRTDEETNFCPGCGARMESEVSDEM